MTKIKAFFKNPFVQNQIARFIRLFFIFFTPAVVGMYKSGKLTPAAIGIAASTSAEVAFKVIWPAIKARWFTTVDESDNASAS